MYEKTYLKFYIFMVIFYGLLLVYFVPAMQSPDENTHFYNSYAISKGAVFADADEDGNRIGRRYPDTVGRFVDYYQQYFVDKNASYQIEQLWTETYVKQEVKKTEFKAYWNADTNPIAYIGPIIGMWIVMHTGVVPLTLYNLLKEVKI